MKRLIMILTASLLIGAIAFTSCDTGDELQPTLAELSQDDDEVASYFEDVLDETDELSSIDAKSLELLVENSGTRTVETTFSGDTIIRSVTYSDFVNGNAQRQRIKNGKITVKIVRNQFPGEYKRIVTMDNFRINGNKIEGTKVIERSLQNQYSFTVTLTAGKIAFTDGTMYTRECTRTRTWASGYNTPFNIWDDEFEIEGSANGINRNGNAYSHQITSPLLIRNTCRWIVQGVVNLVVGDKSGVLDYGDGACDAKATVTINGKTYEINLRGDK